MDVCWDGLMIRLAAPDPAAYDQWRAAVEEFDGTAMDGSGFPEGGARDTTRAGFAAYLADRARQADVTIEPDAGRVHCTYFWILDDDELVGFLALRHAVNEVLLAVGGHIGYSVRPSCRGRGFATSALMAGLDEARALGIEQVLVTCSVENRASQAVIERCGGVFEDVRTHPALPGDTRRYWFGRPPWPSEPTAT